MFDTHIALSTRIFIKGDFPFQVNIKSIEELWNRQQTKGPQNSSEFIRPMQLRVQYECSHSQSDNFNVILSNTIFVVCSNCTKCNPLIRIFYYAPKTLSS